jgi:hypothetical protein
LSRRLTLTVFLLTLVSRIPHLNVLWVEECYPMAAAINILAGRFPYTDFWFDKPPLTAFLYTVWGAQTAWPLRIAGAGYITLCAWLASRIAGHRAAGLLLAFFLIFDTASAVMVLGPDLLTLAPVLAAVLWRERPLIFGAFIGLAFQFNAKAVVFLALSPSLAAVGAFAALALPVFAIPGYWQQVWEWGTRYAAAPLETPATGLAKTAGWLGFHVAPLIAFLWRRDWFLWRWALIALLLAWAGGRYFPRYYFHLLPPLVIGASLAWPKLSERLGRWRWAVAALLLIPLVRFGPQYLRVDRSPDLALFRDARQAAEVILEQARPGDTLFVWGYRPEIDVLTRLPGGSPFLESQPLTGVLADRHLRSSEVTVDGAAQRRRLATSSPVFVVDGLGRYNPDLAITSFPDLKDWLAQYQLIGITRGCRIYCIRR